MRREKLSPQKNNSGEINHFSGITQATTYFNEQSCLSVLCKFSLLKHYNKIVFKTEKDKGHMFKMK